MVAFVCPFGGSLGFGVAAPALTPRKVAKCTGKVAARRSVLRAMAEDTTAEKVKPVTATQTVTPTTPVEMDYEDNVVQKWVAQTEDKIEEIKTKVSVAVKEFDPNSFKDDISHKGSTLFDNFVAGEWLGRGEVYGGVQAAFAFFLLQDSTGLDGVANFLFGPIVLLAGMVLSGKALVDLGVQQLSIWPKPAENGNIVTEGLYSYVRHPVYSGLLLASLGWSASTHSPARFAISVAFALFLEKKIEVEEEFLREEYPDYSTYEEEVPFKLVPKVY